jgi:AcrR family transcriptional regulator
MSSEIHDPGSQDAAGGPAPHTGTSRHRAVLSRESIVEAAIEIVDAGGPDALTMRAVAGRLGSGVMSLYRHVPDREALLDLVLDAMTAEIPETARTGDWRVDLAALARDVRQTLLRRPHLTVLLTARGDRRAGGLAALERALDILRQAGFSPRDAVLANHALGNYVAGAALWEARGFGGTAGEERRARRAAAAAAIGTIPVERFPAVSWAATEVFAGTIEDRFEFGLATLIDGMAVRLGPGLRHVMDGR